MRSDERERRVRVDAAAVVTGDDVFDLERGRRADDGASRESGRRVERGPGLRRWPRVRAAAPATGGPRRRPSAVRVRRGRVPGGAATELAVKCDAFTLLVHDDLVSYRNPFCAECNNVTRPLSGCRPQIEDRFSTSQRLFSASNKATGNAVCSDPNANPDLKKRFCSS